MPNSLLSSSPNRSSSPIFDVISEAMQMAFFPASVGYTPDFVRFSRVQPSSFSKFEMAMLNVG